LSWSDEHDHPIQCFGIPGVSLVIVCVHLNVWICRYFTYWITKMD
jgi:hypothetical protein